MATALYRIIKSGFVAFWRNGWLSTATLAVMVLTLVVAAGLILFSVISKTAIQSIQDKIDISVYFSTNAPEDDILKVKRTLESLSEVKEVKYVSREAALEIFREKHKSDETISQAVSELGENPLSASLNIKARNPEDYSAIAAYLNNEALKEHVDKVSYAQNQLVIERLISIISTGKKVGTSLVIFLALVAVLVAFNTIRLAIYSNRDEIGIMRLVGASNSFIRGPYVIEGIIYGVLGGIMSFLVIIPTVNFVSPYVSVFIPEMNLADYFKSSFLTLLGYQILLGVVLGVISSSIAISRYLKV